MVDDALDLPETLSPLLQWPWWVFASLSLFLVLALVSELYGLREWLHSLVRLSSDSDRREDWSLTIQTTPVCFATIPPTVITFQEFHFYNHSQQWRRVVDFKVRVPARDGSLLFDFDTVGHFATDYREYDAKKRASAVPRGLEWLPVPVVIEPMSYASGRIDFKVNPRGRQAFIDREMNLNGARVTFIDRISGQSKEILIGQHINGLTGEVTDPRHPPEKKPTMLERLGKTMWWRRGAAKKP